MSTQRSKVLIIIITILYRNSTFGSITINYEWPMAGHIKSKFISFLLNFDRVPLIKYRDKKVLSNETF